MTAHFHPGIEKIVFLIRLFRAFLNFFEFQIVAALFPDLRNTDDNNRDICCLDSSALA